MPEVTREQLHAYLDDCLPEGEIAKIEQILRSSEPLRQLLRQVLQERDRGEHSLGAIWRRERLSCPTREHLGSYLLEALEPEFQNYVTFHVQTVGCPFCRANLADLKSLQEEPANAHQRRRKFFQSSAGLLSGKSRAK